MTTFLIALVVVMGAVCVLNLLLTVGVIRRLRQHTEKLAGMPATAGSGGSAESMESPIVEVGEQVDDFAASTVDGEPVSRDLLAGVTLVGVFTPGCRACSDRLPGFVSRAADFPGGRGQVLAVVIGEPDEVAAYQEQLAPVARVVSEPDGGPVGEALRVRGFPAFGLLESDGTVVSASVVLDDIPMVSPATV